MIINQHGELLQAWYLEDGPIIHSKYKDVDFAIGVYFNEDQKTKYAEITKLKEQLAETDFQAIKFSDGAISEEKYAPIRENRKQWRKRINEIEETFTMPTLSDDAILHAEKVACIGLQI